MAHGGYARRRPEERRPLGRRSKGLGVDKKRKKAKSVTLKNQIRSTERMLRKNLPPEVREAQEKKLDELKKQQEIQTRLAVERKIQLRDRKIKFFERRKIERMIRRLEKQHRSSSDHTLEAKISDQLSKLREDLEYVRFFPKSEKYVSLFVGGDKPDIVDKRDKLRKQIKANLIAAAASGKDLEETASDDDVLDTSDDDFFLSGSSSDEAEADDEWTDKSARGRYLLEFSCHLLGLCQQSETSQQTEISQLRSYQCPPPAIHHIALVALPPKVGESPMQEQIIIVI
ncbi:rRNA-processing protein Efg1 protein [Dioscorea alata]|uniref:rRNA-processing protein Efg1 protein n=1 Tax=Dioscorea alata TaxID=55571 RepID=A0ACB7ULI4_DIOAL|nr:rRNA-processing protein Efg1 protein [Dioscorea alata]